MKNKKKLGLNQVLEEIKRGLNPSKISEKYSIPKQTLDYSLRKLKDLGCIEKEGYGVWKYIKEVPKEGRGTLKPNSDLSIKEIRGHAFIWKIEFFNPYEWKEAVRSYRKKKLTFNTICAGKILRTILEGRKIWLTKNGMTIYEPLDFMGKSSYEVKGKAVYEMDKIVKKIVAELGLKMRDYRFSTSREHYAQVKNALARQYNDKKKKMIIRNEEGTAWLWIDHSKGDNELETGEAKTSRQVQNFWNDNIRKHEGKVNASFVLEGFEKTNNAIKKNTENLDYHAENMRSHVKAVQDLSAGVAKQNELFERIAKALEERKL